MAQPQAPNNGAPIACKALGFWVRSISEAGQADPSPNTHSPIRVRAGVSGKFQG